MEHRFCEPEPPACRTPDLRQASCDVGAFDIEGAKRVVIVADLDGREDSELYKMCMRLKNRLPCETEIIDISAFPFAGGCLGCFHCAGDGTCIYKDGFDRYLRENIQSADALVYAYTVRDHSMGYRFKLFDDRQFCNGYRTVTMGKPVAYLVDGALEQEPDLRVLMEARAQVGGNALAGIVTNEHDPDAQIDQMAYTLCYIISAKYQPPKNFYGVGGLKIFRDLIWQMQGLMRADHKFYKEHRFYDFPQKKRFTMMAMYLVGFMMNSPKLRAKLGGRMTEGMTAPYKKVLSDAEKKKP